MRATIVLLLGALGVANAQETPAPAPRENPIHITFVIHFDPLPAPGGQVLWQGYQAERDNLAWLADYLAQLEQEKGKEFVPRLMLELAGDHAEWYLEDEAGLKLLQQLYAKGIHSFGTHFHRNYKAGHHLWYEAQPSPQAAQRVTHDHIAEVDRLIGRIIGSADPSAIRRANHTITGHLVDQRLAAQMGFDVQTGGRNEAMNLFFDHDVYNPWRPALGWPLAEDLTSGWLTIPQAPVLGTIGEHAPLPSGVPEEYTRGMRSMIWQDISVPAMKRKFLQVYLEWRLSAMRDPQRAAQKVWVFGWHEHTNDLFPDDAAGRRRKLRGPLMEFVEWLNANYVARTLPDGSLITRYSNTDEVREAFLAWEAAHPGQSSFNYPVQVRDWKLYPYELKGLAWELMYAHYNEEIAAFMDRGVHVCRMAKADGRNWELCESGTVSSGPVRDLYLLWSNKGEVVVDVSDIIGGDARQVEGRSGNEAVVDTKNLTVSEEPIILEGVKSKPGAEGDGRVPIQFRMNVNYFADEAEARRNCRMLRWHLDLFKQAGMKASYWFTGLAAEQVQRLDPEFVQLLNEAAMPIAHHGANRPPNPQPIHRVRGEKWEDDVQAILDYESYALDPQTGELDRTKAGGLKQMQQMFDNRIQATGRFFEASILYVTKQFGCRAMVGLKGNTGAATEAGWLIGMKGMPDTVSIGPEMLRAAATGQLDLSRLIEGYITQTEQRTADPGRTPGEARQFGGEVQSVAVLIHDHDFLRGPPVQLRQLGEAYANLVRWAAKHPHLRVVTHEDILEMIADDQTKIVSRDGLLKAAGAIAASPVAPPDYVDLGGDYLSLADAFQAFAQSLRAFAELGELPESVKTEDVLGPTEAHISGLPSITAAMVLPQVRGQEVVGAAEEVCAEMTDRIPSQVSVGTLKLNPAEFLFAMAQTVSAIADTGTPALVSLHAVDVLPRSVRENPLADPLTKLQFWTFKPERWKRQASIAMPGPTQSEGG